jgi:hypothetical protein
LVVDTLENLKVLLRSRWQREQQERQPLDPTRSATEPRRVYIICDAQDEAAIEPLEDYFFEHGVEVSVPGFEASESEVLQVHLQNLRDCDAALIYYGAAGNHWVDFNIRDLQKAAGYRDSRPIPVTAVYLAPPMNRRKERFKSVVVPVIRQVGERFDGAALSGFLQALGQGQGNIA